VLLSRSRFYFISAWEMLPPFPPACPPRLSHHAAPSRIYLTTPRPSANPPPLDKHLTIEAHFSLARHLSTWPLLFFSLFASLQFRRPLGTPPPLRPWNVVIYCAFLFALSSCFTANLCGSLFCSVFLDFFYLFIFTI